MVRATLHEIIGKSWIEVERLVKRGDTHTWESVGRTAYNGVEQLGTVFEAAEVLHTGLDDLLSAVGDVWETIEAVHI